MPDTALDILRAVLECPLLGPQAGYEGTISPMPSSTIFSDAGLVTFTNDTRYRNYRVFFPGNPYSSQERVAYSTNGALGQIQMMQPVSNYTNGDQYFLLRDFGWGAQSGNTHFLGFLNDTCRSLYFDQHVTSRGITDLMRYTLPTPISAGGWVQDVYALPFPFEFSDGWSGGITWYRLNPLNVEGDLYLVLNAAVDASTNLTFLISRPYAHPHMSAYTMTRSVLVPFGETAALSVPRGLLVAGVVWRILRAKVRTLTGAARAQWMDNLQEAARWYATECASAGVRKVGERTQGYPEPW